MRQAKGQEISVKNLAQMCGAGRHGVAWRPPRRSRMGGHLETLHQLQYLHLYAQSCLSIPKLEQVTFLAAALPMLVGNRIDRTDIQS